tara:strand:+ start:166 stop:309 length:144 start_codon:yes stop_codon:yes gene_type:complete
LLKERRERRKKKKEKEKKPWKNLFICEKENKLIVINRGINRETYIQK